MATAEDVGTSLCSGANGAYLTVSIHPLMGVLKSAETDYSISWLVMMETVSLEMDALTYAPSKLTLFASMDRCLAHQCVAILLQSNST